MKYLFVLASPVPRAWHGAGTKRMLEEEGSKGGWQSWGAETGSRDGGQRPMNQ